jgi:hypothetical protein
MKSVMLKAAIFLLLCIGTLNLSAQYYVSWDYYGIGFQFAQDFTVSQNSGSVFEASSSDRLLYVKVQPWVNGHVEVDDLYDYAVQYATNLNYYLGAEVAGDYIEVDDFNGYFLIAATNNPRNYNYYLVAYLLDTESDTNYQLLIGYQEGHLDEATGILASFYAYD